MPRDQSFEGRYYDGRTAARHEVAIAFDADGLVIADEDGRHIDNWSYEGLHILTTAVRPGEIRLGCRGQGCAGLAVRDARFIELLLDRAPDLASEEQKERIGPLKSAAYAALAAGLVLLIYFSLPVLARWSVPFVPLELEREWGTMYARAVANNAGPVCADPAGRQVLERLTAQLASAANSPYPLEVRVLDIEVVNAVALPGGHVFIFSKLIDEAASADELAGVLAHEIGHVQKRHAVVSALEEFGLAVTMGAILGEMTWIEDDLVSGLIGLSYTREMEVEADRFAADLLERVDMRRDGLVSFFERLTKQSGAAERAIPFLSTHPPSEERASALRADKGGKPALSDESWAELKQICRKKEIDPLAAIRRALRNREF